MYKVFDTINLLYQEIEEDKNWQGPESTTRNRYPIRFVLFENFSDYNEFVQECSNHNIFVQSMESWMCEGSDDVMLTYSQLAKRFEEYIKNVPANDFVIAPFSEIARFYDNENFKEFDSLVMTIRLIQSPEEAQEEHQRIYVPIIGMQGKISRFKNDPNINIWELRSTNERENYRIILTKGTIYGVSGLGDSFTICNNFREWLTLWKIGNNVKKNIICSSLSIFNCAEYAQPDNAFNYIVCNNVYEFLRYGLKLNLNIQLNPNDVLFWETLASQIHINHFNFEIFVNERFNTFNLSNVTDFVRAWIMNKDDYMRWLLKIYFLYKNQNQTYLSRVLNDCGTLSSSELLSKLATRIFDEEYDEETIYQRLDALIEASKQNVQLTDWAEEKIKTKLEDMAINPEKGYYHAMKYMTPLTMSEKMLMIEWLGSNKIDRELVENLFPELYHYTKPFIFSSNKNMAWINSYFNEYRKSKIANKINSTLSELLIEKNFSSATFDSWRNEFKTIKTLLYERNDIDVFYWIDGLGVDWIPLLTHIIGKYQVDKIYLNEIYIATAELPTTTDINRKKLEELSEEKLMKIGDIDSYAHKSKDYPQYILNEFYILTQSLSKVLEQYNGKKIAFISDHGISYMPGLSAGYNLAGIKANHAGRCAVWEKGNAPIDNKYIVLEDGKTICSLTYDSLSNKTNKGQGAHGGATPEEVLVPIIIVSSQKNPSNYSVKLIENEISAVSPIVRYKIMGLKDFDTPKVLYNGDEYPLEKDYDDIYVSTFLHLKETSTEVEIIIGNFCQKDKIIIKTGVEEEDLFGDI